MNELDGLDAVHRFVESAAKEYFQRWPAACHAQELAFQDAVFSALQKAWQMKTGSGE